MSEKPNFKTDAQYAHGAERFVLVFMKLWALLAAVVLIGGAVVCFIEATTNVHNPGLLVMAGVLCLLFAPVMVMMAVAS